MVLDFSAGWEIYLKLMKEEEAKASDNNGLSDEDINWPVTEKLRKEPKFVAFNKWANDNGIIAPNVLLIINHR